MELYAVSRIMRMSCIILLAVMQCSAQLFPFSNLRQYFEQQWKGSEYSMAHVPISEQSSARPYRHADIPHVLSIPAISESFDLIDGFSKNNKEDQKRLPIKRDNNNEKKDTIKLPTRRIQVKRGNQKTRKQQPQPTDEVLVTPRPHVKPEQTYTKTKPTKAVQLVQESGDIPLSVQTTQHIVSTVKPGIDPEQLFVTPSSTQGQPTLVESIPSLTFAVQPTNSFVRHGGLVDYLTPPKLPSVYNLKQPFRIPENYFAASREDDIAAEMSKLKPPPPAPEDHHPPKKEKQFVTKKYKNDSVKSTSSPVAERHPVAPKKQVTAETTRHVRRRPASKQLSAETKAELLQAGSQMNEQITAETGFHHSDGHEAAAHLGSDQRVEFQMHGQNGPKTYKFGFDTGKGHNRQFRYEEKDKHGYIKGHYGFYDKSGKLQIVNYEAHPDSGFKANPA